MEPSHKVCNVCKVSKPLTAEFFAPRNDKKSKCFRSVCISCRNAQGRAKYKLKMQEKHEEQKKKIQLEKETNMKICTKCLVPKPISTEYYAPHAKGRYGLHSICYECVRDINRRRVRTPEQKLKNAERAREYRQTEKGKAYIQAYSLRPTTKIKREHVHEKRRQAGKIQQYEKQRYHSEPLVKLRKTLSVNFNTQLKSINTSKPSSTMEYVGCTKQELLDHLNSGEYTMEDYIQGGYDIDHIIPSSYFMAFIELGEENKIINTDILYKWWNYRNLRVYPARENKSKGAILDRNLVKKYNIEDLLLN